MATTNLTDAAVRNAKAKPKQRVEVWDSHTPGLCLLVNPRSKTWVVRYRVDGKQRRYAFAEAGVDGMSLADARIEAAVILRAVKKTGADPAGDRLKVKAEAKAQPIKTFRDLANAYTAACRAGEWKPRGKRQSDRTLKDADGSLDRHILPALGDMKLEDVTRPVVRKFLRGMAAKGIGAQTNKALAVIRQIYSYAIAEYEGKLVAVNVATGQPREAETPRSRVLTDDELKRLWNGLRAPGSLRLPLREGQEEAGKVHLSRSMAILLQLSLLLLQRRNEIAGMMVSEVDLAQAVWLIPAPRMKARKPHLVPLPARAVELITEAIALARTALKPGPDGKMPTDFPVFPSPRDVLTPIRPGTVTHAAAPVMKALEITDASPHDLRRTGSTALTSERIGVSHFIRSLVLSHTTDTGGGAAVSGRHYDANTYITEKRRALVAWESLLLEIVGEKPRTSNVREFPGAAA
ncbi:tyrosine-type recombinase/integrase [Caulobacter sp. KR2-114]|uniref:tyrosine-type recombinase/integrase n=1 Tax=Caulobacter sp. KR2-114 TaxID=3400912 RepID=UPI003C03D0E9